MQLNSVQAESEALIHLMLKQLISVGAVKDMINLKPISVQADYRRNWKKYERSVLLDHLTRN